MSTFLDWLLGRTPVITSRSETLSAVAHGLRLNLAADDGGFKQDIRAAQLIIQAERVKSAIAEKRVKAEALENLPWFVVTDEQLETFLKEWAVNTDARLEHLKEEIKLGNVKPEALDHYSPVAIESERQFCSFLFGWRVHTVEDVTHVPIAELKAGKALDWAVCEALGREYFDYFRPSTDWFALCQWWPEFRVSIKKRDNYYVVTSPHGFLRSNTVAEGICKLIVAKKFGNNRHTVAIPSELLK